MALRRAIRKALGNRAGTVLLGTIVFGTAIMLPTSTYIPALFIYPWVGVAVCYIMGWAFGEGWWIGRRFR